MITQGLEVSARNVRYVKVLGDAVKNAILANVEDRMRACGEKGGVLAYSRLRMTMLYCRLEQKPLQDAGSGYTSEGGEIRMHMLYASAENF